MTNRPSIVYPDYLHLDAILQAQHPLGPPELGPQVQAAEHFFIVLHQAFELWLRQVLLDLDCATQALTAPRYDAELALEHLGRVAAIQCLLERQMSLLTHLTPADFLAFRPYLGTASGSESVQFRQLHRALGLRTSSESPVYVAFRAALDQTGLTVEQLYRQGARAGVLYRVAEMLIDIAEGFWQIAAAHVHIAARTMGDRPGTGGTSGVAYLEEALKVRAFPELWAVRTVL